MSIDFLDTSMLKLTLWKGWNQVLYMNDRWRLYLPTVWSMSLWPHAYELCGNSLPEHVICKSTCLSFLRAGLIELWLQLVDYLQNCVFAYFVLVLPPFLEVQLSKKQSKYVSKSDKIWNLAFLSCFLGEWLLPPYACTTWQECATQWGGREVLLPLC